MHFTRLGSVPSSGFKDVTAVLNTASGDPYDPNFILTRKVEYKYINKHKEMWNSLEPLKKIVGAQAKHNDKIIKHKDKCQKQMSKSKGQGTASSLLPIKGTAYKI